MARADDVILMLLGRPDLAAGNGIAAVRTDQFDPVGLGDPGGAAFPDFDPLVQVHSGGLAGNDLDQLGHDGERSRSDSGNPGQLTRAMERCEIVGIQVTGAVFRVFS